MALNLAGAGIDVRAWNRTADKIEDLAAQDRIETYPTAAEAASGAEFVISMLTDADAVLAAMDGAEGALAGAQPGTVWIQMSTIGLAGTESCAQLASRHQLGFVDAPVSGTKHTVHGTASRLTRDPIRAAALLGVGAIIGACGAWLLGRGTSAAGDPKASLA